MGRSPNVKKYIPKSVDIGVLLPHIENTFPDFTKEMLEQIRERTVEGLDLVVVDWKGMGEEKERIIRLLDEERIPYERAQRIR